MRPLLRTLAWEAPAAAGATGLPGVGVHPGADRTPSSNRIRRELGFTSTPFAQRLAECCASATGPAREAVPLEVLARPLS